jgi:DNA anti-recombination protein RmuC
MNKTNILFVHCFLDSVLLCDHTPRKHRQKLSKAQREAQRQMNQREKQRLHKQASRKRKCNADNSVQTAHQKQQRLNEMQHNFAHARAESSQEIPTGEPFW